MMRGDAPRLIDPPGLRYQVVGDGNQVIAETVTRWTAECLLAGMKASGSPTWAEGRFSIHKKEQPA